MTDVVKPLFTTLATIVPATLIYVIGQILTRFILEPIQDQARTVGRIAFTLLADADLHPETHKTERLEEASRSLRELAAQLRASRRVIPAYPLFAFLRFVINKRVLLEASASLVHWSNAVYQGETQPYRDRLAILLKVPGLDVVPPPQRPSCDNDDLTDDDRSMDERNICSLLAQDIPRPMAA
ncbi:MAG: hypothetical protein JWN40_1351 [Phycisphaerales bacterium]|nr:hypothetical protein [Phycisphaerales bacterium]